MPFSEIDRTLSQLIKNELKLLYVAPERLVTDSFIHQLKQVDISFIAVDEAHCISFWGHDFRPEYRQLKLLKDRFPDIPVHAYTATATEIVCADISHNLNLRHPEIIVGSFDRPNLVYSTKQANNKFNQICTLLDCHPNESGIIYCISRKNVDKTCERLVETGYRALPYHAGMNAEDRRRNQEAFTLERTDIIVATVAFGMGIDKSNVRFVIHSGMPKSIEHYQQESGRAGRDGLAADCLLIYSSSDIMTWQRIMRDLDDDAREIAGSKIKAMYNYCTSVECRHKALVRYFGQTLNILSCGACDVCKDDLTTMGDALIIGQKILSCVKRLKESFGGYHTALVLVGSESEQVFRWRHDLLSTYGILSDYRQTHIRTWIEQLFSQDCLTKSGEFDTLSITEKGWRVIRGEETPILLKPPERRKRRDKLSKVDADSWEGVNRDLFEKLRALRSIIANEKNMPAYIVFGDVALRDMARKKPQTLEDFLDIYGVGNRKADEYCKRFTDVIREYIDEGLPSNDH